MISLLQYFVNNVLMIIVKCAFLPFTRRVQEQNTFSSKLQKKLSLQLRKRQQWHQWCKARRAMIRIILRMMRMKICPQ